MEMIKITWRHSLKNHSSYAPDPNYVPDLCFIFEWITIEQTENLSLPIPPSVVMPMTELIRTEHLKQVSGYAQNLPKFATFYDEKNKFGITFKTKDGYNLRFSNEYSSWEKNTAMDLWKTLRKAGFKITNEN